MNNYKIYSLNEPNSEVVRYIGITKNELNKRYNAHYSKTNNSTHKTCWIKSLRNKNTRPSIVLIEDNLTREDALKKEIEYIKLFKSFGANLTNMTDGGDVGSFVRGRVVSNITREKLRQASLGKKHSEETKRIIGIKSSQKTYTEEWCRKNSEAQKRVHHWWGVAGMKGKKHSRESIDKIKKNHKGMIGKSHSLETKLKMKKAWIRRKLIHEA